MHLLTEYDMPVFEFDVDGNPGFCTYVQFWLMVAPVAEVITNTQQTPKLSINHLKELFDFVFLTFLPGRAVSLRRARS